MRTAVLRIGLAAIAAALALAACAKHEEPSASPAPSAAAARTTRSNPCNLPNGWDFAGSCTVGILTHAGGAFELAPDRGIGLSLLYGPNNANGKVVFIIGTAAGEDQISGKLNGQLAFPAFGTVGCVTPDDTPTACGGKALLYVLVLNLRSSAIAFPMTPAFTLRSIQGFPAFRSCNINTMQWAGPDHTGFVWVAHALFAAPSNGELHFAPTRRPQHYASGGALTVFAVACG
jgi:hypothetical protein